MITVATIITECFNAAILALTPVQRYAAMRKPKTDFMVDRWFITVGIIAIVLLTIVFFIVTLNRIKQERKSSNKLFDGYAGERDLNGRERKILLKVAGKAQLKRNESIFTLVTAYDRGAALIVEYGLTGNETGRELKELEEELSFLREKLGFKTRAPLSKTSSANVKKLSSRQIPIGKKVQMVGRKSQKSDGIEAIVVKNSDSELAVRLSDPIKISFGEPWCVRYYFGSSAWEFDTSVISYDGDLLFLKHNNKVKFISRRRFLHVPVQMSGFIAHFTFERPFHEIIGKDAPVKTSDLVNESPIVWGPPKFVPAVITELAGPGLQIETSMKLKAGERILVVFNLKQESEMEVTDEGMPPVIPQIAQDIGEVRHVDTIDNGFSIAVELTGLSDSNFNEMIRATNAASVSANKNDQLVSEEDDIERAPAHIGL